MVGRVLQGMEVLSVMPRGTGPLGFYENPAQRTMISSVRLGSELSANERVNFAVFRQQIPKAERAHADQDNAGNDRKHFRAPRTGAR